MVNSFTKIDEELFEELEELLVMGDVGVNTAGFICDRLRQRIKEKGITDPSLIMGELKAIVSDMLQGDNALHISTKPSIILVIGVNGVGKTTTIGKLASRLKGEGKSVILGAADTFRGISVPWRSWGTTARPFRSGASSSSWGKTTWRICGRTSSSAPRGGAQCGRRRWSQWAAVRQCRSQCPRTPRRALCG